MVRQIYIILLYSVLRKNKFGGQNNEAGQKDYPFFWTSTTHLDGPVAAAGAVYISFGRAIGQMHGKVMDVHGAGAQRSDPKVGSARLGHGPQGDAQRVQNYVRLVRGGKAEKLSSVTKTSSNSYPNKVRVLAPKPTRPVMAGPMSNKNNMNSGGGRRNMQGPPEGGGRMSGFVERLDKDNDGKVSRSEFDGPKNHFDRFDRNNDGYISEDEAPSGPPL